MQKKPNVSYALHAQDYLAFFGRQILEFRLFKIGAHSQILDQNLPQNAERSQLHPHVFLVFIRVVCKMGDAIYSFSHAVHILDSFWSYLLLTRRQAFFIVLTKTLRTAWSVSPVSLLFVMTVAQ